MGRCPYCGGHEDQRIEIGFYIVGHREPVSDLGLG